MGARGKTVCPFCNRSASRTNGHRHAQSFHFLCSVCLSLERRTKHRHFTVQTLGRKQLVSDVGFTSPPFTSNCYIPMECRSDCVQAMLRVLAAKHILETDIYSPALFLLAMIQRNCLACLSNSPALNDLHICRSSIDSFMGRFSEIVCILFGIDHSEEVLDTIRSFLLERTHE